VLLIGAGLLLRSFLHVLKHPQLVISTEAPHSLIMSRAVDKSASAFAFALAFFVVIP